MLRDLIQGTAELVLITFTLMVFYVTIVGIWG
jgi:hypothetical protein